MFTVTVDCVGSGNTSTWRPLSSRYSVMPSTVRTLVAFARTGGVAGAAIGSAGFGGAGAATSGRVAPLHAAISTANTTSARRIMRTSITRRRDRGTPGDQNSKSTPANHVV